MKTQEAVATQNTKARWMKVFLWALPSLATFFVMIFVMGITGVWPFGKNIIGYIDYSAGLVPAYNHLWDIFHGQANIFADWNLGGGSNAWASWGYFLVSPIDWIVAVFPRELVAFSISIVVVIKLCLMAFSSFWLFKKLFKNVNTYVLTLFAVMWAFSGWTMIHYTNVGWLDIMILLPFFVFGVKHLKDTGKIWPLVLVLSWMLLLSYYISYMALLGLVVCAFVFVFTASKKGTRKKFASNLFFAVTISIMLSAVIFVPSCLTSLGAHRFSTTGTSQFEISYFTNFFSKLALLLFYSLPIFYFIKLCFKIRQDKKIILWFVISIGVCCLGLVIEPINMMWHTGSYYCFPYRYAFVIIFLLTLAALFYINKFCQKQSFLKEENSKTLKLDKVLKYVFLILTTFLFVLMCFLEARTSDHPYRTIDVVAFLGYFALCVLGLLLIFLGLKTNLKTWTAVLCVVLVCSGQVLCWNFKFLGNHLEEQNFEVENIQEIDLSTITSNAFRLKDKDSLYIQNLPLISKQPALETWIHISSENQWLTHTAFGYETSSTILKDTGGTLFSDMILGIKYVMSEEELSSALYTKLDSWQYKFNAGTPTEPDFKQKTVYLFETKQNLPYLFGFNNEDKSLFENFDLTKNPFEIQNEIYRKMFEKNTDILKVVTASIGTEPDENGFFDVTLSNSSLAEIYFFGNVEKIKISEKDIRCHNGIVDLGTFSGTVNLKVKTDDSTNLRFSKINISDLQNLANEIPQTAQSYKASGNKIEISFENLDSNTFLFVPTTYLGDFTATVNGKKTEVLKTLNGFLAVKIENGTNKIEITFTPSNLKLGSLISAVALVLFVVFFFLNKKFKLSTKQWVVWIGTIGACIIVFAVFALVFARPIWRFLTGTF